MYPAWGPTSTRAPGTGPVVEAAAVKNLASWLRRRPPSLLYQAPAWEAGLSIAREDAKEDEDGVVEREFSDCRDSNYWKVL